MSVSHYAHDRKPADLFVNDGVQGFALRATDQFDVYKLGSVYVIRTGDEIFKSIREFATGAYVSPGTRLIDDGYVKEIKSYAVVVQYGNDEVELSFENAGLRLV